MSDDELDEGARAIYERAREGIFCEAWDDLSPPRKIRWHNAYRAAIAVREGVPERIVHVLPREGMRA